MWQLDAACSGVDTELFFPESTLAVDRKEALAICAVCPVREACLADALADPAQEDLGIRGGMTVSQRREIRAGRPAKPREPLPEPLPKMSPIPALCVAEGCGSAPKYRGLCSRHHARWRSANRAAKARAAA